MGERDPNAEATAAKKKDGIAAGDPAEMVAEREEVRWMKAQITEAQRVCLLISVVGGFSAVEIAHQLDLSEAAARQRLVKARKQFRQIYSQESGEAVINGKAPVLDEKKTSSDRITIIKGVSLSFSP